ncbi:hypothetical protein [Halorhabdus amylolytica]|uniref:hypothetical protein n=1 Tax=Halorhabdus amylolytica TaxID=2559573 RepID=UPI0010A9DDE3|nr:hypothetical protein [Halorhabdus amylolytica]
MGILLAEDYFEYIERQEFGPQSFGAFRRGAWPEFIGDLRTIAQRENGEEAYDRAHEIYKSAGDYQISTGEQEHMRLTGFFRNVRQGLGHDVSDEALEQQPMGPSTTDWLEYKRERLPEYLNQLDAQGEWALE